MDVIKEFKNIYNAYGENLYRTVLAISKNRSDAEDIVQNTFLKLYVSSNEFASMDHIKNWLYRVAINDVKNTINSRWHHFEEIKELMFGEENPFIEQDSPLLHAVEKLSTKYREVIILYYYEELSIREISRILSVPESTIQTRLQRGREKLQKMMKEDSFNEF